MRNYFTYDPIFLPEAKDVLSITILPGSIQDVCVVDERALILPEDWTGLDYVIVAAKGSGKSTLTEALRARGYSVSDSDDYGRYLSTLLTGLSPIEAVRALSDVSYFEVLARDYVGLSSGLVDFVDIYSKIVASGLDDVVDSSFEGYIDNFRRAFPSPRVIMVHTALEVSRTSNQLRIVSLAPLFSPYGAVRFRAREGASVNEFLYFVYASGLGAWTLVGIPTFLQILPEVLGRVSDFSTPLAHDSSSLPEEAVRGQAEEESGAAVHRPSSGSVRGAAS